MPPRPTNVRALPPESSARASTSRKMSAAAMPAAFRPCAWVAPTATAAAFFATPASSTPHRVVGHLAHHARALEHLGHAVGERLGVRGADQPRARTPPSRARARDRRRRPCARRRRRAPAPRSAASRPGGTSPFARETTPAVSATPSSPICVQRLPHPLRRHGEEDQVGALELVAARAERAHLQPLRQRDARPGSARSRARESSRSACSAVRHSSVVRTPARSSRSATAVPKEPAPTTVARRGMLARDSGGSG